MLRSEPVAYEAWQRNSDAKERFNRRLIWEETVRGHSQESPKQIRLRISAVYAWLYRNDRQWLNDKVRALPSGRVGNHSSVDWESRDLQLKVDLAASAEALCKTHELPLTTRLIFSVLPKLATALEKRNAYSGTRSLLRQLTGDRSKSSERSTDPIAKAPEQS